MIFFNIIVLSSILVLNNWGEKKLINIDDCFLLQSNLSSIKKENVNRVSVNDYYA